MIRRSPLRTFLATAPAALFMLACAQDVPTATETVQLRVIANAQHGGKPMATDMTQEVTSVPPYAGDADGTGHALLTINLGQGQVCWETTVSDIVLPATASHIHAAPVGVRGPIVVFLSPPDETGWAEGCASGVDPDLLRDILTNPTQYYVNVHTTDFPAGAVRGQLAH